MQEFIAVSIVIFLCTIVADYNARVDTREILQEINTKLQSLEVETILIDKISMEELGELDL